MFNLSGSELIFLLLIALVILGPEKLPDAMRRAGKAYSEFKKMSSGFQSEFHKAMDEPMREMRETANLVRESARLEGMEELLDDVTKLAKNTTAKPGRPKSAAAKGLAGALLGDPATPKPQAEAADVGAHADASGGDAGADADVSGGDGG